MNITGRCKHRRRYVSSEIYNFGTEKIIYLVNIKYLNSK